MRTLVTKTAVVYSCTGLLLLLVFSMFLNATPNAPGVLSPWTKGGGLAQPISETPLTIIEITNQNAETQSSNDLDTPLPTSSSAKSAQPSPPLPPAPPPTSDDAQTQTSKIQNEFEIIQTKNNGKVVLLTGATGPGHFQQVDDFNHKVISNRREYAYRHGYDFMTVNLSSYVITHTTHPVWGKLPAILEAFEKYPEAEWIWWLDIDAIIMSPEVDLYASFLSPSVIQSKLVEGESILVLDDTHQPVKSGLLTTKPSTDKLELLISQDHAGLNAGSFLIRNTPMMKLFIDLWSDSLIVEKTPAWAQREQDALTYMIVNHPYLRDKVGFVPQSLFNSYVSQWQPGDLLVHFAGCWVNSECSEWFNEFWGRNLAAKGS